MFIVQLLSIVSAIVALALAVLWACVGGAALTGRLKRNRWFGVRSDQTMKSEEAFALGNKVAAPGFLGAALVLLIGGVLAFGGRWGFVLGFGAILVGLVIVSVVAGLGMRIAATVPDAEESGGCGCCSGSSHDAAADHDEGGCADDPASDCGASSCGSCALQGMCTTEAAPDAKTTGTAH